MLSNIANQGIVPPVDAALQVEANVLQEQTMADRVQAIIEGSALILNQIEQKIEPVEALDELNKVLNIQSAEINHILQDPLNNQLKKEFYQKVFKNIVTKMLDGKALIRPEYLPQILRFFKNVLINYFPFDIEDENLCEVVHQIFNLDASLYTSALSVSQGIRRQSNQDTGDGEPSREHIRLEYERAWRDTLKVGDRVDAVKVKQNQQYKIAAWSRGIINKQYSDDSDSFQIIFDNDSSSAQKIVSRYAFDIAPEGTFTDDIEWRFDLKAGDQIDCLDSESTWYRSTVLENREGPQGVKEIYVGYRVYEEEGHKNDDDGRKYVGWSNRYDEWKPIMCPTVQRFNTVVKHYKQAGKTAMMYDIVIDDLNDVLYDTKERKVWAVYRQNFFANLRCIADYVNEFGRRGGFEKILQFLVSPSETKRVNLRHMYYLMDFLAKTQPLWQKQFACYYIPKAREAFERGILFTNAEQTGPLQLPFTKETLTEIQKFYQKILRRHYTQENYGVMMAHLQFALGFLLLKSEKLEKRIQGLKEVVEQVKQTKFTGKKNLSAKEVIQALKDQNIFEIIFGDNYHIQLIQRSTEIVRFFISEGELGEQEINCIWSSTLKDQQTKMEVYKVITDTANLFRNNEIEILVNHFASVSPEQFVDKEIECVYELSKYSYKQADFSTKAANLFWEIAIQERPYKKSIIELAIDKFIELIRNWERDQKMIYITKCVNNIGLNKAPLQSIKIITKLLDQIPNYKSQSLPTNYDVSNQLVDEFQLLEKLVSNIRDYEAVINSEWTKGSLNADSIDKTDVLDLPFTHRSHIFIRLNFYRQMLQSSQTQIKKEHLEQIWELLTIKSNVTIDSEIFFNWLKQIINDHNKLSPELTKAFFEENVCRQGVSFKNINKAGFDCICSLFLQINELDDKLMIIQFSSMGNGQNQNNKLDFRVHVPPSDLDGIEVVWKMLQECDKKNHELTAAVIDLITKIYHNISCLIDSQIHEIEDQFIYECLRRLTYVVEDPSQSPDEKKQMASITSLMLRTFFEDSEKNGTGGLKSHNAIDKGEYLSTIIVQNNITTQKNTPKMIKISTYSNMTVWELKKIVGQRCKITPLKVQLNRADTKKKVIIDADNIKLLSDIKLSDYELLTAQKKPITYQSRVPLLNSKRQLVPEARKIFQSWFERFSVDGIMTYETCVDFVKDSTSDQTVTVQDNRVQKLFEEYDKDNDGKMTLDEFLSFYRDRSQMKPELVWSNLSTHHIGNDLRPTQYSHAYDDDPLELKQQELLPRYKTSSKQETFDHLFTLIDKLQSEGAGGQEELWTLILSLRTNPRVYANLLNLNGINELVGGQTSAYKLLYCLQILESFINEHQVKRETEITSYFADSDSNINQFPSLDAGANGINDQANSAPKSGVAIPLPAQSQGDVYSAAVGGNVPQPPTNVPFIGPSAPPQGNNNANLGKEKVVQMIQQFKGNVTTESITTSLFNEEELAQFMSQDNLDKTLDQIRSEWIANFINSEGFQIIAQLLSNLNENCKKQRQEDVLKSKVDKDCLTQILKVIKVLLMSAFCGNAASQELALQLQRKMSSKIESVEKEEVQEEQKPAEITSPTKSIVQQQQENTAKEYEPLIETFRGPLGQHILRALDFKEFQQQVLSVIQIVIRKSQSLTIDDRFIIEQALSLWICCIIYNADLLNYLYEEPSLQLDQSTKGTSSILIEEGLVCSTNSIRDVFKDTLLFICQNVKSQTIRELPGFYFLRLLINGLPMVENRSRETKQYFSLLQVLLTQYFEAEKYQPFIFQQIFQKDEFLKQTIQRMLVYTPKEKKGAIFEDCTLEGYLNIINQLIQNNPSALDQGDYYQLAQQLVEKYLFTFNFEALQQHITKEIDMAQYEAKFINKCHTNETRQASYNLLITLAKQQPQMISELISKYWYPLLQRIKKPKKAGYAPKAEQRSFHGYVGLKNLGNICYMNSMIQQFFHIPAFKYSILSVEDKLGPNMQDYEGEMVNDNVLHQFIKLMGFMELSDRQDFNMSQFCYSFKDYCGQPVNVRVQQDAQEFLNVIFDKLDNILANTSQKYLLKNIFGGKTCSMMICKSCGNLRQRQEDFYNLSLEVKNQKSIYDGLKKFISGEIISDFQCEACNQRVDVEKKTVIEKLPNTLIIHMQRILFDYDTLQNQKLNTRVEFPNVLNLKPFMLSEVLKEQNIKLKKKNSQKSQKADKDKKEYNMETDKIYKASNEDEKDNEEPPVSQLNQEVLHTEADDAMSSNEEEDIEMNGHAQDAQRQEDDEINFEYKLVGVVVHMGTADAGHYISYININRDKHPSTSPEWLKTENDKWLEFNDSLVKDYKFKSLEEDCFGGASSSITTSSDFKNDYSRNAYMLIYEKRITEKMRVVISEELLQQKDHIIQYQNTAAQTLDCDRTTISRNDDNTQFEEKQSLPHLLYAMPQLKQVVTASDQIFFDEESKEHYTLIDLLSVEKFVPNEIYLEENEDNQTFLCEKHVMNNQFFKCTQQLIDMMINFSPESLSQEVGDESGSKLFEFTERLIFDLLAMTSENKQLPDLTKLYLRMLSQNDDQTIKMIKKRILNVDNQLQLTKNDKTFMENLLSNMEKEVRDMYQVILTFSVNRLFELFGEGNELLEQIMDNILALMPDDCAKNWLKIDQYLAFIYNVTKNGEAQLDYMVKKKLVTKLVDFFLENESPLSTNFRRQQMGSNYASPPFEYLIRTITFIARNIPIVAQQQPQYEEIENIVSPYYLSSFDNYIVKLSDEDMQMLTCKQLFIKAMKNGYECNEIGRLAAHISFENPKFSRSICKQLVLGINAANGDNLQPYLDVLEPILGIVDSLQLQRYEWILGIPQIKVERSNVYNMMSNLNNLKAGVSLIDHVTGEVFDYKSTLFKTQSTVRDSLLQTLYQYRVVLRAACNDTSNVLYKYIAALPAPTYTYENYLNWIPIYLQDTIDKCAKNASISSYRQDQLLAINIQSQLESLDEKISLLQNPASQAQQVSDNLSQHQALQRDIHLSKIQFAEPYLVVRVVEQKQIDAKQYGDGSIQVNVYELTCDVSESAPNGISNFAIPQSHFQNNFSNRNNNNYNNNNNNNPYTGSVQNQNRVPPLRGNANNNQRNNNNNGNFNGQPIQTRRNPPGTTRRKKKGKQSIVQRNPTVQVQDNIQSDTIPQKDDDNVEHPAAVGPGTIYQESPQDATYMEIDQEEIDGEFEDEEETDFTGNNLQDQDAVVEGQQNIDQYPQLDDNGEQNYNANVQGEAGGSVPNISADNQSQNIAEDYWHERLVTILGFTVQNLDTLRTQKILVKFIDRSENGQRLNFRVPETELPCQVLAGKEREILIFTKLRPFDEWGNYDFEVEIASQKQNFNLQLQPAGSPVKQHQVYPENNNHNNSGSKNNNNNNNNYNGNPYNNQDAQPMNFQVQDEAGDVDMAPANEKACPACTFMNLSILIRCEMCDTLLK